MRHNLLTIVFLHTGNAPKWPVWKIYLPGRLGGCYCPLSCIQVTPRLGYFRKSHGNRRRWSAAGLQHRQEASDATAALLALPAALDTRRGGAAPVLHGLRPGPRWHYECAPDEDPRLRAPGRRVAVEASGRRGDARRVQPIDLHPIQG